jgi:hypothetical protein
MNCPCGCGYSDRFRTCGFNPDAEFTDKASVDPIILEALAKQDPVQVGIYTYHLSRGGNVYRMLNEAYRVGKDSVSRRGKGKASRLGNGVFASSTLEASPKANTPMKNLHRYLDKIAIRGSHKGMTLEDY